MNFSRVPTFFALAGVMFSACNQAPQPAAGPEPRASDDAITFQFSKAAAVEDRKAPGSWCRGDFSETVLLNADPANLNRRYFLAGSGVLRVAVQAGNTTSSFFLRLKSDKEIEIFTSDNYPMCLSNRAYFAPATDGRGVRYDGKKYIKYDLSAQPSAEGTVILLEIPPEAHYGLSVHRCKDCH